MSNALRWGILFGLSATVLFGVAAAGRVEQPSHAAAMSDVIEVVGQAGGAPSDIALADNLAAVAVGRRVYTYDLSQPDVESSPGISPMVDARIRQIALAEGLAVEIHGDPSDPADAGFGTVGGLAIFDVADPDAPRPIGELILPAVPRSLAVRGDHALVALGTEGAWIIDLSAPTAPRMAGRLDPPEVQGELIPYRMATIGVAFTRDHAVVLDRAQPGVPDLVRVVDVSTPSATVELGRLEVQSATDLTASGDLVLVGGRAEGNRLPVISVEVPSSPELIGHVDIPGMGSLRSIEIEGDRGVVIDSNRTWIIDLQVPSAPVVSSEIAPRGRPAAIALDGDQLGRVNTDGLHRVDGMISGVEVFELGHDDGPRPVLATNRGVFTALGVDRAGEVAVVAAAGAGLQTVSLADRPAPIVVGELDGLGAVTDVAVRLPHAVVTDGSPGPALHLVDISDPAAPVLVGSSRAITGAARTVSVAGEFGFVGMADRLLVFDLGPVGDPDVVHRVDVDREVEDIATLDGRVYLRTEDVSKASNEVFVFAATPPFEPLGVYEFPGGAVQSPGLAVHDDHAYLPVGLDRLEIVDASAPEAMQRVFLGAGLTNGLGVGAEGDRLLMSSSFGLGLFDIGVPDSATQLAHAEWGTRPLAEHANAVWFDGRCALVAHYTAGLLHACRETTATEAPDATATTGPVVTVSATSPPTPTSSVTASPTATRSTSPTTTNSPVTASPDPSATPTDPSDGPGATDTASTPTATPTASSQPPSTMTPGSDPPTLSAPTAIGTRRLFVPLALAERCPPRDRFVDVALTLDTSTSMLGTTSDGVRKIDAVIDAATTLVDGLRMRSGHDRVAIVAFNSGAELLVPLTSDRERVVDALAAIQIAEGSRLDRGIGRALTELVYRGRSEHLEAIVLLSDGKVNGVPRSGPRELAENARRLAVDVHVVGFGSDPDVAVLREIAGSESRLTIARSSRDLRAGFIDLRGDVPCPPRIYWGHR